jgi:hypothetical protein
VRSGDAAHEPVHDRRVRGVLAGQGNGSPADPAILVAVLIVHELGHAAACAF